jgi:putative addiction module component (TIGR02574 family)
MSDAAATLLQQALALPPDDRRWLADQLDASLGTGESQLPDDPEYRAELDRRLQSIADGTAILLDGEQVMRELRERLARGRQP